MEKKIAILYDNNKQITDIFRANNIVIYEKNDSWEESMEILVNNDSEEVSIRDSIKSLIKLLGSCKVIIGTSILGIPYYILDKNGFIICEAEEFSGELLEQIEFDYFAENIESIKTETEYVPKSPVPIDCEGNYFFDFAKLQKNNPEISSKKALLPFLSYELFQSITIICTHIMPWIDTYLEQRNLHLEATRDDGLYKLLITQKLCMDEGTDG